MKKMLAVALIFFGFTTSVAFANWGIDGDAPVAAAVQGGKLYLQLPVSQDQPGRNSAKWQVCASLPTESGGTKTAYADTVFDGKSITAQFSLPPSTMGNDWWVWGLDASNFPNPADGCKANAKPGPAGWLWIVQSDPTYQMGCRDNPGYRFAISADGGIKTMPVAKCRQ